MKNIILVLYILFLPFQLRLPQLPIINSVNLFLILLFLILIFAREPSRIKFSFVLPLFIFLAIWTASFMHTLLDPRGIWTFAVATDFKRVITLVLGYFVFANCLKTKREIHFLFGVFLFTIFLVALHIWRNGVLGGINFADFKRSAGPFGVGFLGADVAGGFLAIFTPFVLSCCFFVKKNILRFICFAGLLICLLGIFTTYSRGSIIALGIASIVIILITAKHFLKISKFFAIIILIILIGLTLAWKYWVPKTVIDRVEGTVIEENYQGTSSLDSSSKGRISMWRLGLELFFRNPWIGVGFKQSEYQLEFEAHNAFILIAAEMGIFGILVFLWFLWRVFKEATLLLNTEFIVLGVGFIGCIVAFVIVNMFYGNFFRDTVVGSFWIILGILAASKKYAVNHG